MQRRTFMLRSGALGIALLAGSRNASAARTFIALDEIKKLRIASGPMAGAFVLAPVGYVNWYFANIGLYPYVASLRNEVKAYLTLYLQRIDPIRSNIQDVLLNYSPNPLSPTIAGLRLQDSDDAYAGTFLSLASRYDQLFNDTAWWSANVGKLKDVAYRNLAFLQKPTGLIRALQDTARPSATLGYLMDNCEAYRGLREFAARLSARGDVDATYYNTVAAGAGNGVRSLFHTTQLAFRPNDLNPGVSSAFYPDAVAQVFPQAYAVTATGLGATQYNQAWTYLNTVTPSWEFGTYNVFPWMILGYVAALRGGADADKARQQMRTVENLFVSNRAALTINEFGFYKRTADLLGVPA